MEKYGNITIIESESRFKKVDKSLIENPNIDCLTLGIYTKLIVLGKKWKLNVKGLRNHLGLSDEKVRKSLSLLEKEGYILRTPARNEKGQMMGWNYAIYPTPINESERSQAGFKNENRQDEEPTPRKTDHSDIGEHLNNRLNQQLDLIDIETNKEESKDESFPKKFNFKQALLDLGVCNTVVNDFLLVRKNKKATNSETAFNRIKREIEKSGLSASDCITISVENSWQGFKAEWVNKSKPQGKTDFFRGYTPQKISDRANDYLRTLKVDIKFEHEGVKYLKDDTFIRDGKRYYRNKFGGLVEVPMGLVARPNENWEYNKNSMVWVQDERTMTTDDFML